MKREPAPLSRTNQSGSESLTRVRNKMPPPKNVSAGRLAIRWLAASDFCVLTQKERIRQPDNASGTPKRTISAISSPIGHALGLQAVKDVLGF
jgi:hypothetical protein